MLVCRSADTHAPGQFVERPARRRLPPRRAAGIDQCLNAAVKTEPTEATRRRRAARESFLTTQINGWARVTGCGGGPAGLTHVFPPRLSTVYLSRRPAAVACGVRRLSTRPRLMTPITARFERRQVASSVRVAIVARGQVYARRCLNDAA